MIRRRLETDTFTLNAVTPGSPLTIQFSPEWPGVRLGLFPHLLRQMKAQGLEADPGDFCVVLRETGDVVGQIGAKAPPDAAGAQEIGYGFNPSCWGKGYATEAVGALVAYLLTQPHVRSVTAQTALTNRPSERVLEKLGFTRIGSSRDARHGELTVWQQTSEPSPSPSECP